MDVTFRPGLHTPIHRWFRLTPAYSPALVQTALTLTQTQTHHHILDPFTGKGTTLIEARLCGFRATGIEINPLLARVVGATLNWDTDIGEHWARHRDAARGALQCISQTGFQFVAERRGWSPPNIHNVWRWWHPPVLRDLLRLREWVRDQAPKHLYWLALMGTVLECANIHRNHPAITFDDERQAQDIDVWATFNRRVTEIVEDIQSLPPRIEWGTSHIINGDSRNLPLRHPVQRIITSPPYPNRFSYVRATRPQLYFTQLFTQPSEAAELDCATIGGTWGRATSRFQTGRVLPHPAISDILTPLSNSLHDENQTMHNYALDYFNDMWLHIMSITRCAADSFEGFYVVGNSFLSGVEVETGELLAQMFERAGFIHRETVFLRERGGRRNLREVGVWVSH